MRLPGGRCAALCGSRNALHVVARTAAWRSAPLLLMLVVFVSCASSAAAAAAESSPPTNTPEPSPLLLSTTAAAELASNASGPGRMPRIVIVPGVTLCNVDRRAWYAWLRRRLQGPPLYANVTLRRMPDCMRARRSFWIPFMRDALQVREDTVVVGHSSGAVAAMRYAEEQPVAGIVLVAPCYTDLGYASERRAGWYPPSGGPWRWDDIKRNAGFIMQFSSTNDRLIPWREHAYVANALSSELYTLKRGHFLVRDFAELADALEAKLLPYAAGGRAGH